MTKGIGTFFSSVGNVATRLMITVKDTIQEEKDRFMNEREDEDPQQQHTILAHGTPLWLALDEKDPRVAGMEKRKEREDGERRERGRRRIDS